MSTDTPGVPDTRETPCASKPLPARPTADQFRHLAAVAANRPLAHPLVFSLYLGFDHAPPTHLIELYDAVYRAVMDAPRAPTHIQRLLPREHGKSEAASHVVPAWLAMRDPNTRILLMSQSETQARKKLGEVRETIRAHGPDLGVTIESNNKTEITLERSATYDVPTVQAAGMNTGVLGGHYDVLLFDDLIDW